MEKMVDKKKIFVTGSRGMIGSRLIEKGCSPLVCDVTDIVQVDTEIRRNKPELIFHLAYKSNVDFCEDPNNDSIAEDVNFHGSTNVFSMAEKNNIPVVFISSDHIFRGDWFGNYKEDSDDVEPKNRYGFSKLMAEAAAQAYDNIKIIRTSVLFHKDRQLVKSYLDKIAAGQQVDPPIFMWRSFMHISHFVTSILKYADRFNEMPTILNISGCKTVSWYSFIRDYSNRFIFDTSLVRPRFTDRKSPTDADRPHRAGLDTSLSRRLGFQQYDYLDGIAEEA